MTFDIYIGEDGSVQHVYDDVLADLFDGEDTTVRRASHVEPTARGWTADMRPVGGPILDDAGTPFRTRAAALAAERAWLDAHMEESTL